MVYEHIYPKILQKNYSFKSVFDIIISTNIEEIIMVDIYDINKRYNEWALKQFPDSNAISSLKGLKRECDETIEILLLNETVFKDTEEYRKEVRLEYADCMMYLIDSARRFGLSLDDLFLAVDEKLQINLKRDWTKNEDNSYSHVKTDSNI